MYEYLLVLQNYLVDDICLYLIQANLQKTIERVFKRTFFNSVRVSLAISKLWLMQSNPLFFFHIFYLNLGQYLSANDFLLQSYRYSCELVLR